MMGWNHIKQCIPDVFQWLRIATVNILPSKSVALFSVASLIHFLAINDDRSQHPISTGGRMGEKVEKSWIFKCRLSLDSA